MTHKPRYVLLERRVIQLAIGILIHLTTISTITLPCTHALQHGRWIISWRQIRSVGVGHKTQFFKGYWPNYRHYQVPIHMKLISAKFWYISVHLDSNVIERKAKWDDSPKLHPKFIPQSRCIVYQSSILVWNLGVKQIVCELHTTCKATVMHSSFPRIIVYQAL